MAGKNEFVGVDEACEVARGGGSESRIGPPSKAAAVMGVSLHPSATPTVEAAVQPRLFWVSLVILGDRRWQLCGSISWSPIFSAARNAWGQTRQADSHSCGSVANCQPSRCNGKAHLSFPEGGRVCLLAH